MGLRNMWPFMIGIAFSELSRVGAYGSAPFLFVTTQYSTGLPRWLSPKGILPAVQELQETWV